MDIAKLIQDYAELKKEIDGLQVSEKALLSWYKRLIEKKGEQYIVKKLEIKMKKLKQIKDKRMTA